MGLELLGGLLGALPTVPYVPGEQGDPLHTEAPAKSKTTANSNTIGLQGRVPAFKVRHASHGDGWGKWPNLKQDTFSSPLPPNRHVPLALPPSTPVVGR